MRLSLYAAPTTEPITLAEAKAQVRVRDDASDGEIGDMIRTARESVESSLGRALVTQTWDLYLDAFPADVIEMPKAPLQSVTSIQYYGAGGTLTTLAATEYQVSSTTAGQGQAGAAPGRISPVYNSVSGWPGLRGGMDDVVIRFVCGYGTAAQVPSVFKSAMKVLIEDLYEERGSYITGTILTMLPTAVERILAPYRTTQSLIGTTL